MSDDLCIDFNERNEILKKAVDMYLQKKRKIRPASVEEEAQGKTHPLDHKQDVDTTTISSSPEDEDPNFDV